MAARSVRSGVSFFTLPTALPTGQAVMRSPGNGLSNAFSSLSFAGSSLSYLSQSSARRPAFQAPLKLGFVSTPSAGHCIDVAWSTTIDPPSPKYKEPTEVLDRAGGLNLMLGATRTNHRQLWI